MQERYAFLESLYQFYDDAEYWPKMARAAQRYARLGFTDVAEYIQNRVEAA